MLLDGNNYCETKIKYLLSNSLKIIRIYDWLIDAYVLDFYTDNHWKKLPDSWQQIFSKMNPTKLNDLLKQDDNKVSKDFVWPLSILSLKKILKILCIPRNNTSYYILESSNNIKNQNYYNGTSNLIHKNNYHDTLLLHPKLKHLLKKCVKPKKRHEIENMSMNCFLTAKKCQIQYVVDFGGGLGHLARTLSYGYGLTVCCLEMQSNLNNQARIIDEQFEMTAKKYLNESQQINKFKRPVHVTVQLTKQTTPSEFLLIVKSAFNIINSDDTLKFGIIGLHPCGDLGAILIDLFLKCDEAKFLNLVGCCYMKLTTIEAKRTRETEIYQKVSEKIQERNSIVMAGNEKYSLTQCENENHDRKSNRNDLKTFCGYPLSKYLSNDINLMNNNKNYDYNNKLSYESREIACHAIEVYKNRLEKGFYEDLKVHSYRAALEKIIIKYWPQYKHFGLNSVKHTNSLTFQSYCQKALKDLNVEVPIDEFTSNNTLEDLENWRNVVIFYTLRLIFAPLIESVILYDRLLYLIENGCDINVNAIFDPLISPRNHLLIATKNS